MALYFLHLPLAEPVQPSDADPLHGLDDHNQRVASGVYFYRLEAVGSSLTKKMVVMK